jgi:tetratricopeptide (TPR) repeat protein
MAKVFLSYDRDDTERARPVALALEKAGHAVWWDLHIRGGEQYTKVIDEALKAADAVVVLWSKHSVESAWVRDEAAAGRDTGRLVPAVLDETDPPLGFRQYQTIDLSRWKGRGRPAELKTLLADVDAMARRVMAGPAEATLESPVSRLIERPSGSGHWPLAAIGAAILIAAVMAILLVWPQWKQAKLASVMVQASDSNPSSLSLARDLVVQLGTLRPVMSDSMRLVNATRKQTDKPDLLFQAAAGPDGSNSASLMLADSRDEVLWSKTFDGTHVTPADLRQQIAYTAARVLRCALEESSGRYGRLANDLRQSFLDACAASGEIGWDMRSLVGPLRKVTAAAPKFRPAWTQLLIAEVNAATFAQDTSEQRKLMSLLKQDVIAARRYFPQMAEATVGEYTAASNASLIDRAALLDKAKSEDPDNSFVLGEHGILMASVGRVAESIDDARRAAQLDPLSPATRSSYIRALLYGGRLELARAELDRAKQLWPGTETVRQAEFSIDLRHGDFEKALRDAGEYQGPDLAFYIAARKNPTDPNVARFVEYLYKDPDDLSRIVFGVQALGEMKRVDEIYAVLSRTHIERGSPGGTYVLFRPWLAEARHDPRFMVVAKRTGLLAYWQESGHWPDFCSDPELIYECKKEAARLLA